MATNINKFEYNTQQVFGRRDATFMTVFQYDTWQGT